MGYKLLCVGVQTLEMMYSLSTCFWQALPGGQLSQSPAILLLLHVHHPIF